ncbi:sporulation-specific N-acetylmuramoyl-L-alanine amidase CwlC [[Clostridium] sordellii]|uniref:N-acetylmuramoyl-L-alanine amidase family protein n=1 Tax=Paraclostridium sordellii TaxID=1505 RepID=UPI0005DE2C6F|nr:N-acetylmuramoyl-L-alanine amidase [Paeniclostridium sordellii]MCQ4696277.1 N-acetylmuramoyl-L-alanine amidase [Paeniclostridium sordellii]CEN81855.1 sporulation-specific N-acetylmuramoyl-L-alanine amidase CwlC [[Clostridium] sordellii] [Paeniclostridium sordellii]CEO08595.1 sporulation-specific N-acetylmuramoyl-L-alanine amidase CwlC [[Clostridium] sordellii] [Paeniclostridium sordellii]CEO35457.1 sporulation-specific N-acetylmuramoyl-L-alanine amidase CwlC [[Clostridium] sordellii] [Paenic
MKWYLDFGHGGKDPGALGSNNTKESNTVLKIGMLVKSKLEKQSEKVITTRESDSFYSLEYRTNKANKESCDYFISIHMNSSTNKTAKGSETWVYDSNSKVYNLAKNLSSNLSTNLNTPNRGVKESKKFSVLKNSKMPALLIEIDFISNPEVESLCTNESYIKNVADTIASTLLSFVGKDIVLDNSINESKLYKVCIGAFKNKSNATRIKNEAISKGFKDTYII